MASETTPTPKTVTPEPAKVVAAATPAPAAPVAAPVAAVKAPMKSAPAKAEVKFVLPPSIYSPELLDSVCYEIEHYIEWYRENRIHTKVGAAAIAEPDHSTETAQVIQAWSEGKSLTLASLEELLEHLRNLGLPVVHLTLAALPNHDQRGQLVDWFRRTVGPGVLISFVGDRNLGGGVLVRTPNRVFDYSWKQRLVEGRSKLAEVVHRV